MVEPATLPDITASAEDRPYTVLSCSVSMDGYISGTAGDRLLLSNDADFDRVDAVRASCDAILVGAQTIRGDDPRLLVRSATRRADRRARGLPATPVKVTVTGSARLDPAAAFFTADSSAHKLVYCRTGTVTGARAALGAVATVVDGGRVIRMRAVSRDLFRRGVRRLMVEGGGAVHTQFLTENIADELHLAVAPVFVGDGRARRFVGDGRFPWRPGRRGRLVGVHQLGDVAVLIYALSERYGSFGVDGTAAGLS